MLLYQIAKRSETTKTQLTEALRLGRLKVGSPQSLLNAIREVLVVRQKRLCFFLDGPDEFAGGLPAIVHICRMMMDRICIKICIASRPSDYIAEKLPIWSRIVMRGLHEAPSPPQIVRSAPSPSPSPSPSPWSSPPRAALRIVQAIQDFIPEHGLALAFSAGDKIEILDDTSRDGWWDARFGDRTGLIPGSFVKYLETTDADMSTGDLATVSSLQSITPSAVQTESQSSGVSHIDDALHEGDATLLLDTETKLPGDSLGSPTILHTLYGHSYSVLATAFSPVDPLLASGSDDKTIIIWDATLGAAQPSVIGHNAYVNDVCFAPDGRTLASGSGDRTVRLWDIRTCTHLHVLNHSTHIESVAVSPDGTMIAVARSSENIELWDVRSLSIINTLEGYSHWIRSVKFSPSGRLLASASDDNVTMWNLVADKPVLTIRAHSGPANCVMSVDFSADGGTIASGGLDKAIRLWDTVSGKAIRTIFCDQHPKSIAFSPQEVVMAAVVSRGIGIWHRSGIALHEWVPHDRAVNDVAFSPNGKLLATCSEDRTVMLWKFTDT